jgi:short-subunit dehydrogenase
VGRKAPIYKHENWVPDPDRGFRGPVFSVTAAKGVIVHTGSTTEYGPLPLGAVYNASKDAMRMYGNILIVEMRPFGVRVETSLLGV